MGLGVYGERGENEYDATFDAGVDRFRGEFFVARRYDRLRRERVELRVGILDDCGLCDERNANVRDLRNIFVDGT